MKKLVLCLLLVLLTLFVSVAVAENDNCCACCSAAGSSSADSASTAYTPKYDDSDYTLEISHAGFRLFLPSSLHSYDGISFSPPNGSQSPFIIVSFFDNPEPDPEFSQDKLRKNYEAYIAGAPSFSIIQVDECYGLMYSGQSDDGDYYVHFDAASQSCSLVVDIISDSLDEALELAQGILSRTVAKDIPLEELEQAE